MLLLLTASVDEVTRLVDGRTMGLVAPLADLGMGVRCGEMTKTKVLYNGLTMIDLY
jgi:hypothetical protein